MQRIGNRIAAPFMGLLFAASLVFGVSSAFAQADFSCKNQPPTLLGACISPASCQSRCEAQGGFQGDCISGASGLCCVCAL